MDNLLNGEEDHVMINGTLMMRKQENDLKENELWRSQQELFIVKSKVGDVEKLASKSQEELLELLEVVKSLKEEKDEDVLEM